MYDDEINIGVRRVNRSLTLQNYNKMMAINLNKITFIIFLILFNSCTKEQSEQNVDVFLGNNMLVFKTAEEYYAAVEKTIKLNYDELKDWEETQGFKSYGRTCEEIYFSIKPDQLNTIDDIHDVVRKYSSFLTLVKDENNEYVLEHFLFNNPLRYIINNNKMFQVKDIVYKVFETFYVYTNYENINELIKFDESDLFLNNNKFNISLVNNTSIIDSKDVPNFCGVGEYEDDVTVNDNKTRLTIGVHQPPAGAPGWSVARCYYIVRPLKKTLGIWFWVTGRTMSASIKIALDYRIPGGWDRQLLLNSYHNVAASKFEGEGIQWVYFGQTDYNLTVHFGAYDCWATSFSTGSNNPVELKCGTLF